MKEIDKPASCLLIDRVWEIKGELEKGATKEQLSEMFESVVSSLAGLKGEVAVAENTKMRANIRQECYLEICKHLIDHAIEYKR